MARRITVAVLGFGVLAFGVALIVLPGPAVLVIPLGLALLATEFSWARKLLLPIRKLLDRLKLLAQRTLRKPPQPPVADGSATAKASGARSVQRTPIQPRSRH